MADPRRDDGRRWRLAVPLALALWAGGWDGAADTSRSTPAAGPAVTDPADWTTVEGLVGEQKYQAAVEAVAALRARAAAAGATEEWTRALVQEVQLTSALGGVEKAVRLLRETPWPDAPEATVVLRLLYADSLLRYLEVYGWEIRQRQQVASAAGADLQQWTAPQIVAAIDTALATLWQARESWGDRPLGRLAPYFDPTDYPDRIRGTLRDTVTYLWVAFLADTGHWQPAQEHGTYRLDLATLVAADLEPEDGAHPLVRLAAVLGDLERWHTAGDRPEAAFEARLELLRRLETSFARGGDRRLLRADLESALTELGAAYPWWSVGQAQLARQVEAEARRVESEGSPDGLTAARDIARRGAAAHPESVGGRRCASIVATLEAPGLDLEAMQSDGAGKRSLLLRHRNLERVHFRAYALPLAAAVTQGQDYSPLPSRRQVEELLAGGPPRHQWSVELPATPDLATHQTYVVPPLAEAGLYVVVVSARQGFSTVDNRLEAVNFVVSDLVVLARTQALEVAVDVRSGSSGENLEGVEVELWHLDYGGGHRRRVSALTGADGRARLAAPGGRNQRSLVLARRNEDANFVQVWTGQREAPPQRDSTQALVYTDRSVYRPGQDVLWKVVAYERSEKRQELQVVSGRGLRLELLDANWEPVAVADVETNTFGSAAGSFTIPAGRLLGTWQLRTSVTGSAEIRVEEYKRPTFEVALADAAGELRLNRPARLAGDARYYFGLPVVEGSVDWQVVRRPRYPEWWGWFRPSPQGVEELVASGAATLDAEGRFHLEFTAEADEREAAEGVTYSYAVSVDVTDAGGETRSAERSYRLGYVAVEAEIRTPRGFFAVDEAPAFEVVRRDLDGAPRAGAGRWRLATLAAPAGVTLPADEPLPAPHEGAYTTPGDLLPPRWHQAYSIAARLRGWSEADTLGAGAVEHGADGVARIELPRLAPGAHRLVYETEDSFGARFATQHELFVAGEAPLELPLLLAVDRSTVAAGETARLLVGSGLRQQELLLEIARPGQALEERRLRATGGAQEIALPIAAADRGGVQVRLSTLRDHQRLTLTEHVFVPPEERDLDVRFASFRDRLRPGSRESWRVVVRGSDEATLAAGAAELLAYMYDRSLDLFAGHRPPRPFGFGDRRPQLPGWLVSLGASHPVYRVDDGWYDIPDFPYLRPERLRFYDDYPIGGPGSRMNVRRGEGEPVLLAAASMAGDEAVALPAPAMEKADGDHAPEPVPEPQAPPVEPPRSDFSETAFWEPHLVTDADGAVAFEFTVPDSVTEWNVWVHALSRDLRYGATQTRVQSVKELLVRPYLPRFLREGDAATVRIVVQNAGEERLTGTLDFDLRDPESDASLAAEFGIEEGQRLGLPFVVEPGGSATLAVSLRAPPGLGAVAVRVVGEAGEFSDGELRALPLLPGRFHLVQSRFAALQDATRRELFFADLAADDDPSRIDERLVVTLDAQLFYSVLSALPYLVDYPYECTEQTLNRFLSTGIVGTVFERYPAVAAMAQEMARRDTPVEPWTADDPNRRMALEETPWLAAARGGDAGQSRLLRILDPRVAGVQRDRALRQLEEAQTSLGGFPWWPGGPPSPYMTLYIVDGLSRALEFDIEVPREMVANAWRYLHRHYLDELIGRLAEEGGGWELVTLLNYTLSSYPDESWTGGVFTAEDRRRMLEHSFAHWRELPPRLKSYLALTLRRADRGGDARLVFDSVMDSARTTRDEGTFWAPEERAWLWYNDGIESHAFALRTLSELDPTDARRAGLVHWLMLNKKLNHWKSTRATAEVIYSLVHYLDAAGQLGATEAARVTVGEETHDLVFEPDELSGKERRIVLEAESIGPAAATIVVEKETPGLLFASATWHFSTEDLPAEAQGDLFGVERRYYKRLRQGDSWRLEPLAEGARLVPGDQVEVHLSLRARHAAEYVHLRDPRAAGFEPESLTSQYRWDLGIGWYEQVRDSGTDFFFDWLPAGEYSFQYRLRANLGGVFTAAPATVQSMYAPELAAYSSGARLTIDPD